MTVRSISRLAAAAIFAALIPLAACDDGAVPEVLFSYGEILRKEYRTEVGRAVPVTIEQSIETEGVFTPTAFCFFSPRTAIGATSIYICARSRT